MLTYEKLVKLAPEEIFLTGMSIDDENGLFMTNSGKVLRWVAVRGAIPDWCIYCHFAEYSPEWIKRHGDKICMESNIKKLVPCDDKAFAAYRY